jgi:hypothetical protein
MSIRLMAYIPLKAVVFRSFHAVEDIYLNEQPCIPLRLRHERYAGFARFDRFFDP